uniref:pancreatic progenitor cell differentiation and proliferation factor-like protein n=1 Tax=Jaculus jaculus TaxID=51337 RepID=UPI0003331311|nr:pancreatic progenitor cell differentiation and proliferation factor-like protein [Jaculus jaculus]
MASVPSVGCLLAKNQYYRKSSISSVGLLTSSDSVHLIDDDKSLQGLTEVADPTWWFKSFFHSEPVKAKDLSANGYVLASPHGIVWTFDMLSVCHMDDNDSDNGQNWSFSG